MKIRNRLILTFGLLTVFVFSTVTIYIVYKSKDLLNQSLVFQLNNTREAVFLQVKGFLQNTSESYIHGSIDQSDVFLEGLYKRQLRGDMNSFEVQAVVRGLIRDLDNDISGYSFITEKESEKIIYHPDQSRIGQIAERYDWNGDKKSVQFSYSVENNLCVGRKEVQSWNWNIYTVLYINHIQDLLNFDTFNEEILEIKIGQRGYPYILNKDGYVITHPSLVGQHIAEIEDADSVKFMKKILENREGNLTYNWEDPDGIIRNKFAYYKTIPETGWKVIISGYTGEFFNISTVITKTLIIVFFLAVLFYVAVVVVVSRYFTVSISSLTTAIKDISEGEGDLTKTIRVQSRDEIGLMADYLNQFINKLCTMMRMIKKSADNTLAVKDELSAGTEETAASLVQITKNIKNIEEKINSLGSNVNTSGTAVADITKNIKDLNSQIENQNIMVEESIASIQEMTSSVDLVASITLKKQKATSHLVSMAENGGVLIDETQKAVESVKKELESINEMASIISGIASQTNLLAMNAAIEAAHAGEAGKGFAVVADEIRKLAEESNDSTSRIKNILKKVENSISETTLLSHNTGESFREINKDINEVVQAFNEIYLNTRELQAGGADLLETISRLKEASLTVLEKSGSINSSSGEVHSAMENTEEIAEAVVIAIGEINTGTEEISMSMCDVTNNTTLIADTGHELSINVGRFKTEV